MSTDYTTYQQHEPLRAPSGWSVQERRFVAQLEELFDDIYRRYNRLRLEDMSPSFRKTLKGIADDGAEIKTDLEITAAGLKAEIERASLAEGNLNTSIEATATGLAAEITRASTVEGNLSTSLSVTAEGLSTEITRATTAEGNLSTSIGATAEGLSAEIKRATDAEGDLSTKIETTASGITSEVSKTYLTQSSASGTYLSKTDASGTYLSKTDASNTYATKSQIVQDDTSWKATFQKIGASGYTASGITTITENGVTVKHTKMSNCYTEMSADGFRIKNSGGTVIGGVMLLNNEVCTAMNTLYNANNSAFKMNIGTYTPYDGEAKSGLGASLKYNSVEFMHFGYNVYPNPGFDVQYNEISSANGLQIVAKNGSLLLCRPGGSSISLLNNDIVFFFRGKNDGELHPVYLSDIWHALD